MNANSGPAIDPVCGMTVDKAKAEMSGRTVLSTTAGPIYFCMTECRNNFIQNPEKYAQINQLSEKHSHHPKDHVARVAKKQSWLEMLESFSALEGPSATTAYSGMDQEEAAINLGEPGIIDWSGVDKDGKKIPPREWRKGWGTFPGSKYLGQKHNRERVTDQLRRRGSRRTGESNPCPMTLHDATDDIR